MTTRTADVIAQKLHQHGCRFAFGIPGGEVLTLIDALDQTGIDFVLSKHENSAGFMAEGVYHATRQLGILVATLGPGVANAINVIANAQQDRVPLLFITGCVDLAESHYYTHQVFDHQALLKPITKASFRVTPESVDTLIDKAIAIAHDGQPGPVHLDLPISVAAAPALTTTSRNRPAPAPMAPAPSATFSAAQQCFKAAQKPLMIVGLDVLHQQCAHVVRDFAISHEIPVITTYKAKGVLPEDHPLALGGAGLSPTADRHLLPLLQQSDCLILVGYDPIEMRMGWFKPWADDATVIEFSAIANQHYMHIATHQFVGDIGAGLNCLATGVAKTPWADSAPQRVRQQLRQHFGQATTAVTPAARCTPTQVMLAARRLLPKETIATVDSGAHRILLSQCFDCYQSSSLLQSTGLCTMGCALPLAVGVKLAQPRCPVVAFIGDACLEMVIGELATVRDLGLPLIIIVFVDTSLALIELKQKQNQLKENAVRFGETDFAKVAQAFGGNGELVNDMRHFETALQSAMNAEAFTLIACKVDASDYEGCL